MSIQGNHFEVLKLQYLPQEEEDIPRPGLLYFTRISCRTYVDVSVDLCKHDRIVDFSPYNPRYAAEQRTFEIIVMPEISEACLHLFDKIKSACQC